MFPTISLYLHQPSDQLSTVLYHQGWRDPITLRGIPGTHSTLSIRPTVKAHSVNLRKRGSCTVQIMLVSPTHPSPSPELSGPESKCVTQQQWKLYCKCLHNYWGVLMAVSSSSVTLQNIMASFRQEYSVGERGGGGGPILPELNLFVCHFMLSTLLG